MPATAEGYDHVVVMSYSDTSTSNGPTRGRS